MSRKKHRHPMEEKISMAKEKQHFNTFHACNLEWIWNIIFTSLLMVVFLWLCQSGSAWDRRHRQPHTHQALRIPRPRSLRPPGFRRNGEPRHGVLERWGAAAVAVPLRGAGGATGGAAAVHWRTLEWQDEAMETGETGELVRNLGRFIGSIITSDILV